MAVLFSLMRDAGFVVFRRPELRPNPLIKSNMPSRSVVLFGVPLRFSLYFPSESAAPSPPGRA
jgi:hypothetical protein